MKLCLLNFEQTNKCNKGGKQFCKRPVYIFTVKYFPALLLSKQKELSKTLLIKESQIKGHDLLVEELL